MKHFSETTDKSGTGKEMKNMEKSKLRNKRLKSLEKGRVRSLRLFDILSMKFAGWNDGRKGLLCKCEDGRWQSSRLKEEIDTYEEYCGRLYGRLKAEEEEVFKKVNILLDGVLPMNKSLHDALRCLKCARDQQVLCNERKVGEENLTEMQVMARRIQERDKKLQPYYKDVEEKRKELIKAMDEIFECLSDIGENFDLTCKIAHRIRMYIQRKIDVYWRSAMRQNEELPPVPDIEFTEYSEQEYRNHYERFVKRAMSLRDEFISEI